MDGVIVNNHRYHLKAWQQFFKLHGLTISKRYFEEYLFGRTNKAILKSVLKRRLDQKQIKEYSKIKERFYRGAYAPVIRPAKGLVNFLQNLKRAKIKIAVATSGPRENLNFVLSKTNTQKYFHVRLDDRDVRQGKPHPEIYLKAAKELKVSPANCVVFEDSLPGIVAAKAAGMKVVGVATTLSANKLHGTKLIIKDFTQISLPKASVLFAKSKK